MRRIQNSNWSAASNDPDVQALKEEENAEDDNDCVGDDDIMM